MIIVTGAGGFIGSAMVGHLNALGRKDIIAIDDLPHPDQFKNLIGKSCSILSTAELEVITTFKQGEIDAIIHIGAISNTLEKDWSSLYKHNILSSRHWASIANMWKIPMVFTSTAAITGNGNGPLNQYAFSKQLSELEIMNRAACLRLFNVYGPNEYHKGRMASTILHWHNQVQETGSIKIFKDSDQYYRDFIYVEDVCRAIWHMVENFKPGVYDCGTGRSESFERVARELEKQFEQDIYFDYIDMPADLKNQYQMDTRADTKALTDVGFDVTLCRTVAEGIEDYVPYLKNSTYL
jgi:ADP-L-glycero-D-manno-heptose 6-epimerase